MRYESIDISFLECIVRDSNNKNKHCTESDKTIVELFLAQNNMNEQIRKTFKLYELALWIIQYEKYRKNKNKLVNQSYKEKDIILANLGNNWGNELSYEHPCVVLKQNYDKIFVVPCSSSKISKSRNINGYLYPNFIEGNISDGFSKQTILIIDNVRWISKSRINKKIGYVKKQFFHTLYNRVFEYLFKSKKENIDKLSEEIINLEKNMSLLKKEKIALESKIKELENKVD